MAPGEIYPFVFRNPVSASTHLLWAVWGLYLTAILWKLTRGDRNRQLSVACFGASVCVLYSASGIYHAVQAGPAVVNFFRLIDHSAIYLLIAGTYTPIFAILLHGRLRLAMLVMVWSMALTGIACKWLITLPSYPITVGLYIAMGWLGLLPARQLARAVGWRALSVGLVGGLLYTTGGVLDALQWPLLVPGVFGWHELVHVLDMAGTLAHVYFLVRYVLPYGQTMRNG